MLEVEHNSYKVLLPIPEENLLDLLDNYNGYNKIESSDLEISITEAQRLEIDKVKKVIPMIEIL
jgi:hypothetical protein